MSIVVEPVGHVVSELTDTASAPKQGYEGAPTAWIVLEAPYADAARDIAVGDDLVVLTWLHLADRDVQVVHPRGDASQPQRGVFSTRSPSRPNPIGIHPVHVVEVDGPRIRVSPLEAVDGTPVLDCKSRIANDGWGTTP